METEAQKVMVAKFEEMAGSLRAVIAEHFPTSHFKKQVGTFTGQDPWLAFWFTVEPTGAWENGIFHNGRYLIANVRPTANGRFKFTVNSMRQLRPLTGKTGTAEQVLRHLAKFFADQKGAV